MARSRPPVARKIGQQHAQGRRHDRDQDRDHEGVERLGAELFKLTVRIFNTTPLEDDALADREQAQLRSFASTHTILVVRGGEFISLTDPPERWRDWAGASSVGAKITPWSSAGASSAARYED